MLLYIDPGTGSMLFTVLIGVISVVVFFLRSLLIKLKFVLSGGRVSNGNSDNIPFVIFSDDKRYWTTFKPICDEFEKRGVPVTYYTASSDDPALICDYKYVITEFLGEGNGAFSRMNLLKADMVLSTTPSLDVFQWKRSRNTKWYGHIFHCLGDPCRYRMFGIDYFDALLLPGPVFEDQVRYLEKIRNLPEKELVNIGLPYLDTIEKRARDFKYEKNSDTTVLLAPSWGSNSILNRYGSKMIDALIKTGYKIIIRPHPQSFVSEIELMDELMAKYPDNDKLQWNRDNDNFDVLSKSDIMISDFSGVVFDYSMLFKRPVIYTDFEFDTSKYDAFWLEDEEWYFKILRQIGTPIGDDYESTIKDVIDDALNGKEIETICEKARSEGWANIGKSAEKTVDYMIKKHEELTGE